MHIRAWRIAHQGGPEVMRYETVDLPAPKVGQVLVRHTAVGVNFIDIYHRSGLYPLPLPSGLGVEAAGTVEQIGDGVTGLARGDRVAYAGGPIGAYAEAALVPAARLVRVPDTVTDPDAAASLLKGLTACYLLHRTFRVQRGHTVLVSAAAGGVGMILCQWASHLGATVIGCVSSGEKAQLAHANGCTHTIDYRTEDVARRVREITAGEGVQVAYDSVGKDTFASTLDSLAPLGMFVSFGNASGPAPDVSPAVLQNKGSLFFTRPSLAHYTARREDLDTMARDLFAAIARGIVKVHVNQTYPLHEADRAHRDLAARATTGSTVLMLG